MADMSLEPNSYVKQENCDRDCKTPDISSMDTLEISIDEHETIKAEAVVNENMDDDDDCIFVMQPISFVDVDDDSLEGYPTNMGAEIKQECSQLQFCINNDSEYPTNRPIGTVIKQECPQFQFCNNDSTEHLTSTGAEIKQECPQFQFCTNDSTEHLTSTRAEIKQEYPQFQFCNNDNSEYPTSIEAVIKQDCSQLQLFNNGNAELMNDDKGEYSKYYESAQSTSNNVILVNSIALKQEVCKDNSNPMEQDDEVLLDGDFPAFSQIAASIIPCTDDFNENIGNVKEEQKARQVTVQTTTGSKIDRKSLNGRQRHPVKDTATDIETQWRRINLSLKYCTNRNERRLLLDQRYQLAQKMNMKIISKPHSVFCLCPICTHKHQIKISKPHSVFCLCPICTRKQEPHLNKIKTSKPHHPLCLCATCTDEYEPVAKEVKIISKQKKKVHWKD